MEERNTGINNINYVFACPFTPCFSCDDGDTETVKFLLEGKNPVSWKGEKLTSELQPTHREGFKQTVIVTDLEFEIYPGPVILPKMLEQTQEKETGPYTPPNGPVSYYLLASNLLFACEPRSA